jgi:hypothetical protein
MNVVNQRARLLYGSFEVWRNPDETSPHPRP